VPHKHCKIFLKSPDQDLWPVDASSPADVVDISDGDDLTTVNLARDGRARESTLDAGSGSRAGFPSGTTVGVDLDRAEVLIAEVSAGPGRGVFISGGQGSEQLGFSRAGDGAGVIAAKVEDELALVVGVLLGKLECDERGDVITAVLGGAGDETSRCVEVDGTGGDGVLAGEIWEECCDGLLLAVGRRRC